MKMTIFAPRLRYLVSISIFMALLSGCISLKQDYPKKRFFLLEATRPGDPIAPPESAAQRVLETPRFHAVPPYDGMKLVSRLGPLAYESNFYTEFFADPRDMLRQQTEKWLLASGLFAHATPAGSGLIEPTHVIVGAVRAILADLSDEKHPRSVLEIQFLLTDVSGDAPAILMQKDYRTETPMKEENPEAALEGLAEGLEEILGKFEADVRDVFQEDINK